MTKKNPAIFIEHILENINKIESFSKNITREILSKDKLRQYAIVRAIEIIGEAIKNLPSSFKKRYPQVPWKNIVGTRDKLIHHYFGVDLNIIWEIIEKEIPKLKKEIEEIINRERYI